MKIKELNKLLEKYIDSDFTVSVGLGSVMQDSSLFQLDKELVNKQISIDREKIYQCGLFSGYKISIDPNMKIHDMRIIKSDGSKIDLQEDGFHIGPNHIDLKYLEAPLSIGFERIANLQLNWDGDGAKAPDLGLIVSAFRFIMDSANALLESKIERPKLLVPRIVARPLGSIDFVWDATEWKMLLNLSNASGMLCAAYYIERTGSNPLEASETSFPADVCHQRDYFVAWLARVSDSPPTDSMS